MAKIKFREARLSGVNKQRLLLVNSIIEEYQEKGYKLTLRQLYYQLVSRDIIANKIAEYQKLSTLLKEGRMGGEVDWDAIEDRLRKPHVPFNVEDPKDAIDIIIDAYALNRQRGQEKYVEVWVEKDALSGVLSRVTSKYHVPILVNRGYSSVSAMYQAYNRFSKALINDQRLTILYLGDFDPSGLDMIRDIKERITEFLLACKVTRPYFRALLDNETQLHDVYYDKLYEYAQANWEEGVEVEDDHQVFDIMYMLWINDQFDVKPIALTKLQIDQYTPPPNPAKITDPRAKEYIKKHGDKSWEVDALKPEVLHELLENYILDHMNKDTYEQILGQEKIDKERLKEVKKHLENK